MFEEEDQLLWCPDVLSERKVEDYLRKVQSQTTDGSTENSTCGGHVRDNEQVCNFRLHGEHLTLTILQQWLSCDSEHTVMYI